MSTAQGSFGVLKVGERFAFAEVIPRTRALPGKRPPGPWAGSARDGHQPVLYVADHPASRVTFDLNGSRFKTQGFRLALMGASGAGKSNALAVVAEEVHRIGYPFLIFDQEGEFISLGDLTGVQVIVPDLSPGEGAFEPEPVAGFVLSCGGGAVVDASGLGMTDQRQVFYRLARAFYGLAGEVRRRCFFFVDEASVVAPQRKRKDAEDSRRWLEHLVARGRKRGIYTVAATQRPSALSKDVLAQFNVKMIGRLDIWQDLDAVKPYLTRRVRMDEISRLESGDFLLDLGGVSEVVHVRRRSTRDLGGTPEE